jgi:hypothetical protein
MVLRASSAGTEVSLRRYASASFPVPLGALSAGAMELLRIPVDRSSLPWSSLLTGGERVTACRALLR